MLLSMTGFGEAHRRENDVTVAAEVRTVNGKYFKLSIKCPDGYSPLEPEIENLVREQIKRGSVQVALRIDRPRSPDDYRLNLPILENYQRQLAGQNYAAPLDSLLLLPGVVDEDRIRSFDPIADWPLIQRVLTAALENLARMRADEGRAMRTDLKANCDAVAAELAAVSERAPLVVGAYRARLEDRVRKALEEFQITLEPAALIREVAIYAERCDISEEMVRLRSHLEQYDAIMDLPESSGRKLDFLTQEMFREANTIGSKSSDVQIARHVIEIKAAVEKIREMIQNVE